MPTKAELCWLIVCGALLVLCPPVGLALLWLILTLMWYNRS